jgi:hypothetical protein
MQSLVDVIFQRIDQRSNKEQENLLISDTFTHTMHVFFRSQRR